MVTMSIDYAQKLKAIRKAEKLTQQKFSDITGLALGSIKRYESGHQSARVEILEKVLQVELFEKYTLWLIHGKTVPAAGQIAPAIDVIDSESKEDASTSNSPNKRIKA
ncbi:helix-turn-helix domain-containing protein [Enterobacter asburiae]|uniref:helix-turn-helix domain-containing protein n=1 Tax=Enterobacter asburiae TaxID=61645 RepID=UPI000F87DB37|nr:helix-turn-helix transcriptional regulator [Enterobacter asburiae]RTP91500.1 XRE family transcriptional regulator [Enterobacter asburiae]